MQADVLSTSLRVPPGEEALGTSSWVITFSRIACVAGAKRREGGGEGRKHEREKGERASLPNPSSPFSSCSQSPTLWRLLRSLGYEWSATTWKVGLLTPTPVHWECWSNTTVFPTKYIEEMTRERDRFTVKRMLINQNTFFQFIFISIL